jgi:TRAP-type C4-dicarboxylate transport system substrate-binding protein
MEKKYWNHLCIDLMLIVAMVTGGIALGPLPAQTAEKPVVLKFADPLAAGHPNTVFYKWVIDEIQKRSKGRIKWEHYPGSSLLGGREILEAVSIGGLAQGGQDICAYHPALTPLHTVFGLPFLTRTMPGQVHAEWQVEDIPEYRDEYEKKWKVKAIAHSSTMSYHIMTTKKPVRTLEDLKGLKIRCTGFYADWLNRIGSTGVMLTYGETYEAMQKGTLDGTVTDILGGASQRFHEVCKYMTLMNAGPTSAVGIMNLRVWNSFSKDIQKMILQVGKEEGVPWWIKYLNSRFAKDRKIMKEAGVQFIKISEKERARWKAAAKPMWSKWAADREKEGLPGRKVLELYKKTSEKYD